MSRVARITGEDLEAAVRAIRDSTSPLDHDLRVIHGKLCDEVAVDPEAAANYCGHVLDNQMGARRLFNDKQRHMMVFALREVFLVGVKAGRTAEGREQ